MIMVKMSRTSGKKGNNFFFYFVEKNQQQVWKTEENENRSEANSSTVEYIFAARRSFFGRF